jgi:two-component system, OmpR family, sensor histidine kinase CpxA
MHDGWQTSWVKRAFMNFKSTVLRFRDRVPVQRLFVKIFSWFWVTALVIIGIVFLVRHVMDLKPIDLSTMYASVAPILAEEAARAYESDGPAGFVRFANGLAGGHESQLFLLDKSNRDVLSRAISRDALRLAREAGKNQLVATQVSLYERVAAYKFVSTSGRPYTLLLYVRSATPNLTGVLLTAGIPFLFGLLFVVTILCFWLAYHIATPIHGIQSAARRVAQGDLSARVPHAVSLRRDELAALAMDFDSMVDRIEMLIRTQKNLLTSVSHELRSPLARLNVSLAVMRKHMPDEVVDIADRMERDVARIDTLIGQLLTLSRLEAGLSSGQRENVNFTLLVQEVVADGNFEAKSMGKSVSLESASPVILENADSLALRSACENIVRNAIHFTRPGTEVKVALGMDNATSSPQFILTICDEGPGVPNDALQNIFNPFFRVNGPARQSEGNGLGLAIALEAIRLHHGSITASNLNPTGLEISVRLPASESAMPRY